MIDNSGRGERPANPTMRGEFLSPTFITTWTVWNTGRYLAEFSVARRKHGTDKSAVRGQSEGVTATRALFAAAATCIDMIASPECTQAITESLAVALNKGVMPKPEVPRLYSGKAGTAGRTSKLIEQGKAPWKPKKENSLAND